MMPRMLVQQPLGIAQPLHRHPPKTPYTLEFHSQVFLVRVSGRERQRLFMLFQKGFWRTRKTWRRTPAPHLQTYCCPRLTRNVPATSIPNETERSRLTEVADFAKIWEGSVLPVLVQRVPSIVGGAFAVDVVRESNRDPDNDSANPKIKRIVLFTSTSQVERTHQETIEALITVRLPEYYHSLIKIDFIIGEIRRCCERYCAQKKEQDDVSCFPKRMFHQDKPAMGASISLPGSRFSGTFGGYVRINGCDYYGLTCDHLFEGKDDKTGQDIPSTKAIDEAVMQPSHEDSQFESEIFGQLAYSSGYGRRAPVIASENLEHDFVRVDWALFRVEDRRLGVNVMVKDEYYRQAIDACPSTQTVSAASADIIGCGGIGEAIRGEVVLTVGRTSGYQQSRVTETKSLIFWKDHNYTLELGLYADNQDHGNWIVSGPGQPGDSGAWVISKQHHSFLGMIYGRGPKWGKFRRIAYFSTVDNILADIRDVLAEKKFNLHTLEILRPKVIDRGGSEATMIPVQRQFDLMAEDLAGLTDNGTAAVTTLYPDQLDLQRGIFRDCRKADISNNASSKIPETKETADPTCSVVVRKARAVGGALVPWEGRHLRIFTLVPVFV